MEPNAQSYICGTFNEIIENDEAIYTHKCFVEKSSLASLDLQEFHTSQANEYVTTNEELLIYLVAERPPLWDYTLKLRERSKSIKDKLWKDIEHTMNCDWDIERIQRKWKSLKDRYNRVKSEVDEYKPSGSETRDKVTWKYYSLLTFLNEKTLSRPTTSSLLSNKTLSRPTTSSLLSDKTLSQPTTSSLLSDKTSMRMSTSSLEFKENIDNQSEQIALNKKSKKEFHSNIDLEMLIAIKAAPSATMEGVNPVCVALSNILKELRLAKRARLEVEFLKMGYEARMNE